MTAPAGLFDDLIPAKGRGTPQGRPLPSTDDLLPSASGPDTATIAANIQRAYARSVAAGTPLSDGDLDAYARRESGGTLGLEQIADWHAARPAGVFDDIPTSKQVDADLWEALTKAGVRKDSATAIVGSRAQSHPADLWERAVANGGDKQAVTRALVASGAPLPSTDDLLGPFADLVPARQTGAASLPAGYAPGAGESAAVHAADQFTMGLGPKAAAFIYHLVNGVPYGDVRATQNAAMDAQQQQHPVASTAGGIAGGIASPINYVLPGAGEAATVGRTALRLGTQGALSGGAQALGHSEGDLADRAKQTAIGAGVGGVTGAGLGGAISYAKSALLNATPFGRVAQAAYDTPGGLPALQARAAQLAAAGRGDVMMPADLSPQMAQAAGAAARANPAAAANLQQVLEARAAGAPGRLMADVQGAMGSGPAAVPSRVTAIAAKVRALNPGASDADIASYAKLLAPDDVAAQAAVSNGIAAAEQAWTAPGSRQLVALMHGLPPDAQQAAREAVANKLVDQLESGDMPELTTALQNKLAVVFPNKATLDAVIAKMEAERAFARTATAVTSTAGAATTGTAKALNLPNMALGAGLFKAAPLALTHPASALGYAAASAVPLAARAVNRAAIGRAGPLLVQQGPDAISALLARLAASGAPSSLTPAVQGALAGSVGQFGARVPGLLTPTGRP